MNQDQATLSNKILLIDDDRYFRDSIAHFLNDYGYSVVDAENGLVGLQQMRLHRDVDLVLVDLVMPVMDGFSFLEAARKDFPNIPIVVISGIGTIEEAIAAIRLGAWDFITKPIISQDLLKIVIDRNIEKYITYRSNKEYQVFLENLAKMRSNQLNDALNRKQATTEACQSDLSIYKNSFKKIPIPVVLVNKESLTIMDANEVFQKNVGLTESETTGRTLDDIGFSIHSGDLRLDPVHLLDSGIDLKADVRCQNAFGMSFKAKLTTITTPYDANANVVMVILELRNTDTSIIVNQ